MTNRSQVNAPQSYKARVKTDMVAARSYTHCKESKHRAEMALIERGLDSVSRIGAALDAPCGVGRATALMAQRGIKTTGVDLGRAAIEVDRNKFKIPALMLILVGRI